MRIRRTENEDFDELEELLARDITEAICEKLRGLLGYGSNDAPVSLELKADIYSVVIECFARGVTV